MGFWKNLSIRKKLSYSILGLTTLLALTAGIISGIKLSRAPRPRPCGPRARASPRCWPKR